MANTENIEAKLCAYVDGELDAAGRAEIEQHLAGNPQHRKLMEELTRTRDLLRDLHRESAPPDITEALHGQLERSVLLDDSDLDRSDASIRINRWPQIMAVAAILLLAVGLAAVVYFVIAPTRQPEFTLAKPEGRAIGEVPTSGPSAELHKELAERSEDGSLSKESLADARPHAAKGGGGRGGAKLGADETAAKDSFAKETSSKDGSPTAPALDARGIQNQLFNSGFVATRDAKTGAETGQLFVVVSTQDPAATFQCVTDYFKENRITWEQVPVPMPAPMNAGQTQDAMASRLNNSNVQLKFAAPSSQPMQQQQQSQQMAKANEPGEAAPSAKPAAPAETMARDDEMKSNVGTEATTQPAHGPAATAAPTTVPTNLGESIAQADQDEINKLEQEQQTTSAQTEQRYAQQQGELSQQANISQIDGVSNNVYYARNMTRRQAGDLQALLARSKIQQRAALIDNTIAAKSANAMPVNPPPGEPRVPGNEPTSQRSSDADADTNQALAFDKKKDSDVPAATAAPATQSVDGTLRGVAAGTTQPAVREKTIDQPQAALLPLPATTQATTEPSFGLAGQGQQLEAAAAPATSPATQTADTEERVDVVVVVQNAAPTSSAPSAETATTEPTTVPANAADAVQQ